MSGTSPPARRSSRRSADLEHRPLGSTSACAEAPTANPVLPAHDAEGKRRSHVPASSIESDKLAVMDIPANDDEWRAKLTPGSIRCFASTGPNERERALSTRASRRVFHARGAVQELFTSATSSRATGWPSFCEPLTDSGKLTEVARYGWYERGTLCPVQGAPRHLFRRTAPVPTGSDTAMNGVSLDFDPKSRSCPLKTPENLFSRGTTCQWPQSK